MKKKLATKKRLFTPCALCTDECTHQPIQVLIVEPHRRPRGANICPKLQSMQDIVAVPIADGSAEAEDKKI